MTGVIRRVSAPAELRVGEGAAFPAWLSAAGSGRMCLRLREVNAVAARERAMEGSGLAARLAGGAWTRASELRFGPAHGSGRNAVRTLFLSVEADAPGRAAPVIVAADHERGVEACRALPALGGVEVVRVREVEDRRAVGALLLGCAPGREPEAEAVRAAIRDHPGLRPILFAGSGAASEHRADLVGSGDVFFAGSGWPEPDRLGPLVLAAVENASFRRAFLELTPERAETEDGFPVFAWYDGAALGQRREVQGALRELAARAERRLPGTTATVYARDEWAEVLLGPRAVEDGEFAESAALGLVAWAAHTGRSALEERAEDAVFFDADLDLAPGAGRGLLAVPIRDASGTVLGVLACHPAEEDARLRRDLSGAAEFVAHEFAAPLAALRARDRGLEEAGADPTLFRTEALEEHRRSDGPSSILNVSERWGTWLVAGMAALLLAFAAFLVFGRATEYAEGNAIVRSRGRVPVIANAAGTVASVRLAPNGAVGAGEVIGTLYDHAELARVERLEQEYEDALVRLLRQPDDPGAGAGLSALRATSVEARAALSERQLTAPAAGVLADVRVRVGALVSPGQVVATVRTGGGAFEIVAAIPGNYRPLLEAGLPVVAELDQFPGSRFHLAADAVSPEVVGPEEARALMGRGLPISDESGALALVYAGLPEVLTGAAGAEYALFDGMRGRVRIPVRQERFIVSLWPALGRGE